MCMYNDSLYRISLKCLIRNSEGEVLVVKEVNRESWDLPGGGMNHGEDLMTSIRRELKEEINFDGSFTYKILALDEPIHLLTRDVWQVRVVLEIQPDSMNFSVGADADDVRFMNPDSFGQSEHEMEQKIYEYTNRYF